MADSNDGENVKSEGIMVTDDFEMDELYAKDVDIKRLSWQVSGNEFYAASGLQLSGRRIGNSFTSSRSEEVTTARMIRLTMNDGERRAQPLIPSSPLLRADVPPERICKRKRKSCPCQNEESGPSGGLCACIDFV